MIPAPQRALGTRSVWPVALGGAGWSIAPEIDEQRSTRTIHAALDAGVTLIDTAHAYTTIDADAHNEALIADALRGRSGVSDVLVATKGGHFRIGPKEWGVDGRPEALRAHCEASLRALDSEAIGLYLLHWPDPEVPIVESVGALATLQDEGKIHLIGVSNVSLDQLAEARQVAQISAVENRFSPMYQHDRPMVEYCDSADIPYLAYSPLGGFGGLPLIDALPLSAGIAQDARISIQRLLLAWLLRQSRTLIAIAGANRPSSITDSAEAPDVSIDDLAWAIVNAEIATTDTAHPTAAANRA